jgi:hypothetical protein
MQIILNQYTINRNISTMNDCIVQNGTPGGIRTPDLRLRSPLLYPTELPGHISGAEYRSRTGVLGLENQYINRYTNPAYNRGDYTIIHLHFVKYSYVST